MKDDWYTFRPIDQWPGELSRYRKRSQFKATWPNTRDLLQREIAHLKPGLFTPTKAVLQIAVTELDFKADGSLRAASKPEHPGVIVAFESRHGPLKYATDLFNDWQDNVRAIALSLEALRKIDRYGVSGRGEQYRGWQALAPPADAMNVDEAAELLRQHGGFRAAAMRFHPDRGGDPMMFRRVSAAKRILEATGALVP